jgi:UDP-N-acetylglucosamine acyltransferase
MTTIHPTAIVEPGARLGPDCVIGPYCFVGADVALGAGVHLLSHVVVAGRTRIGDGCRIFSFASLGQPPQDLKYAGEPSELAIGRENIIREQVTMNPGTRGGGMLTRVGDRNLFMVGVHIAHDCEIGNHVVMANLATLGGHVRIGDHAIVGGLSAIHQFVRIGRHAMVGGASAVERDVVPFGLVTGNRAKLNGLNLIGLKRRGFTREQIDTLRAAFSRLFANEGSLHSRLAEVQAAFAEDSLVAELVEFMRSASDRGFCRPELDAGAA